MRQRRDDVNGKQVAGGCFTIILMFAVISLDISRVWQVLLIFALIILGCYITGAFKN